MMNLTAAKIFLLVLLSAFIANAFAQKMPAPKWDAPKIKGIRQESYSIYEGKPYFTDKWCVGNILLTNGESIDSLYMRYSSFKDELIYFNSEINIQIKIDKTIISAFSLLLIYTVFFGQGNAQTGGGLISNLVDKLSAANNAGATNALKTSLGMFKSIPPIAYLIVISTLALWTLDAVLQRFRNQTSKL